MITLLQTKQVVLNAPEGEIINISFDSTVMAGSLILFVSYIYLESLTDSLGNVYTRVDFNDGSATGIWYTVNSQTGIPNLPIDGSWNNPENDEGVLYEYSGVNTLGEVTFKDGYIATVIVPNATTKGTHSHNSIIPATTDTLMLTYCYGGGKNGVNDALGLGLTINSPFNSITTKVFDSGQFFNYSSLVTTSSSSQTYSLSFYPYFQYSSYRCDVYDMVIANFYYVAPPTNPCIKIRGKCKLRGNIKIR
jgi:hypothetical protein